MLIKPVKIKIHREYPKDNVALAKKTKIETLYVGQLHRTGKVFMGICPFHQDSKPSFAIYPETNSWYCFAGCGGGDVIDFYMRLNNLDFKDAINDLK